MFISSKRLKQLEARIEQLERDTRLRYDYRDQEADSGVSRVRFTLKDLVFILVDALGMRTRLVEPTRGGLVVEKKPAGL